MAAGLLAALLAGLWAAGDGLSWAPTGSLAPITGLTLLAAAGLAVWVWRLSLRLDTVLAERAAESARHHEILDALEVGLVLYDRDDRLVLGNRDFRKVYPELEAELVPGSNFETVLRSAVARGLVPAAGPDALDREAWVAQRLQRHRQPGRPLVHETRPGHWRRIVEQRLDDGSLLAHSVDVTELVRKEQALHAARAEAEHARQRLVDAIEALPDAFVLYDADDRLVLFNRVYAQTYHLTARAMVPGTTFETLLRYGLAAGQYPQAAGREQAWLAERLQAHHHPSGPILQELPDNRWMRIDERRTRDGGLAGVRTDVTTLVRREQELQRLNARLDAMNAELSVLSDTDALTGLANRRRFDRQLATEWKRAHRHAMPLALLLLDLDHFKRYNDRHGHPAGDACLRRVAELLQGAALRPTDLVARIGGEEFAVLLPHQDGAEAEVVARRCMQALTQAALAHGDSPVAAQLTLSIGIAHVGGVPADVDSSALVAAADTALYRAKQEGRTRAVRAAAV